MPPLSTKSLNVPLGVPARSTQTVDTVFVPNVAADIITGDSDILTLLFVNKDGSPNPKIRLTDGNGKSFVFYDTVVSSGFPVMFEQPNGLRCTGKLTWVCDTANSVEGKIEYK